MAWEGRWGKVACSSFYRSTQSCLEMKWWVDEQHCYLTVTQHCNFIGEGALMQVASMASAGLRGKRISASRCAY